MDDLGNRSLPEAWEANVTYTQSQVNGLVDDVSDGLGRLSSNSAQILSDLGASLSGEDLANITSTAGDVARRYIESKIQAIKDSLTNKTVVEVRALVQEVSPYVKSPNEAGAALKNKLTSIMESFGPGGSFWKDLGEDFLNFTTNDAAVQSTLANLNSVKLFADTLNTASDAIETARKVFKILEPIIPIIEVTAKLFSAARTQNAADGQLATMEIQENVNKLRQQLTTLMLGSFRKYVFSLKIRIPNLFLNAINTLSVRDAITKDWSNGWLGAVFDEDFYDQTVYSYTWEDSWNKTIRDTLGSAEGMVSNWENFNFTDFNGNPITRGEFMKSRFMTVFTQNFMKRAVATARKDAKIRIYNSNDWVKNAVGDGRITSGYTTSGTVDLFTYRQHLMDSNSMGLSPFNTTASIRTLSNQILERYI